jgi:hypothetical protein
MMRRLALLLPALLLALAVPAPAGPPAVAGLAAAADPGQDASAVLLLPGQAPRDLSAFEAAALPTPQVCSDYQTLATSGAYSTKGNVCLFESTGTFDWGTVARFICYKNGVRYGAGTGGCRWVWNQVMQRSNDGVHWETRTSDDWCYTCEGIFVDDSGRFYGSQQYALWCGYTLRGATRGTASQPYRVRFYRTDGTEVVVTMKTNISGHKLVPCTAGAGRRG